MNKYYCPVCKLQFEADGTKSVANCPTCNQECFTSKNFDELVESLKKQQDGGCCGGGSCCG